MAENEGHMITSVSAANLHHLTVQQIEDEQHQIKEAQKDPRKFEPIYTRYYERIVQYIYHRVENKELAFEITAQVFYRALENLSRYKPMGVPFSAWLFRIASNELNQWFRKNKSNRLISIDDQGLHVLQQDMNESGILEQESHLAEALQELDEQDIELVNMRFFERRSFKEICEILDLGESACKMRLYRILEKLKTAIQKRSEK